MQAEPGAVDLGAMMAAVRRWVEIESPTRNATAVNKMIDAVQAEFAGLPVHIDRRPGRDGYADQLAVRSIGAHDRPGILILSHVDTVHPLGTLAERLPFRQHGDRVYGPGIYDMKAGAFLALDALRRVLRAGTGRLPVVFLFTSDEEVGSPTSRDLIEAEARHARYALVTEPARDGGKIVTTRKGVGRFEVTATGVPAHSGSSHQRGHSAIKEMARQVLAIEGMTDYARGITTTVGMITGGTAPNVIPQHCRITVDLRVADEAAGTMMEAAILGLTPVDPQVRLEVTGGMNRPPFEKTPAIAALYAQARDLAREIGFDLVDAPMVGGGSDGNFTAALGVPTLDGLGADGDGAHTEWEYALASSFVPRSLLMQRLLETLA